MGTHRIRRDDVLYAVEVENISSAALRFRIRYLSLRSLFVIRQEEIDDLAVLVLVLHDAGIEAADDVGVTEAFVGFYWVGRR